MPRVKAYRRKDGTLVKGHLRLGVVGARRKRVPATTRMAMATVALRARRSTGMARKQNRLALRFAQEYWLGKHRGKDWKTYTATLRRIEHPKNRRANKIVGRMGGKIQRY